MATFDILNAVDVNGHTEKKKVGSAELTYLSWAWAWAEVKKKFPEASYTIWKNENNLPFAYDPATGYMVYTTVTIEGITHEMWLPVMDGANKAMKSTPYDYKVKNPNFKYATLDPATGKYFDRYKHEQPEFFIKTCEAASMMDINKTVMRCLVKNLAMFGLGLYIYAGEDLPEGASDDKPENEKPVEQEVPRNTAPAEVTSQNKLPEAAQKPVNPVLKYIANEQAFMAGRLGITDPKEMRGWFAEKRKSLIEAGVVEDIPATELTKAQAEKLVGAIYATFMSDGEAK